MLRLSKTTGAICFGCTTLIYTADIASAQIGPDPARGHALARALCTTCHIIGNEAATGTVPADVPSFVAIANKPNQTAEAIAGRIVIPHPPMPDIALDRVEIADLATYILSLRHR